jgi:uncharacterized protein YbjT (DUF2867 family)
VLGLRDAEAAFTRGRAAATFVRAAYFMENWGGSLFGVAQGVLPSFLLADKAIPLVATRDIGIAAARLLAEGGSGKRVIELAGPREYSPRDVAAALASPRRRKADRGAGGTGGRDGARASGSGYER